MKKIRTLLALTVSVLAFALLSASCGLLPIFNKMPELPIPSLNDEAEAITSYRDDLIYSPIVETTIETIAETTIETKAVETAMPEKEIFPEYHSILETIKLGINNDWEFDEFEKQNISYLAAYAESPSDIVYALYDLDSDGSDELIVSDGFGWILNVYTMRYDGATPILWGYERVTYDICENGYIIESGADGAAAGSYAVMLLKDGYLNTLQNFYYEEEYDPNSDTYISKCYFGSGAYYIDEMSEISEDSMHEMLEKYKPLELDYTPIK
ncbi:MAG: hypothetical protein IJN48_01620 [Clostridia bacterium]|nr:hypothetical protein [Clostridia bacterium]